MKKRVFGFVLSLSMIIGMLASVSVRADMGISHESEVSIMAALGIVPGYPDNYKADAPVSQTDFIKYAFAAVGVEILAPESYAKNIGLDGASSVTAAQAAEVIAKATGYSRVIGNGDAYTFMQPLGVFNGCSLAADAAVTSEAAAVILYNVINMPAIEMDNDGYVKSDLDIMEDKLGVYKITGIVTANGATGLRGYKAVSGTTVRIGDEVYNIGNTTAQNMLGKAVRVYYKDDDATGEYVIKWIDEESSKNREAVVYGCDVRSVSDNTITYDSSSSSNRKANVAADADIIYNGVLTDTLSLDAVRSLTAETTLISNNGGSAYNVVIIKDYAYYLVDSYASGNLTVNDFQSKQALDVDEDNYSEFAIYKDGVPAKVSDIVPGQVLAVTLSEDGRAIVIEILTGSVSGEITAAGTDSVIIGGMTYDISPAYTGDRLKIDRTGTFYFDKLGKIVRCSSMKGQTSKYGYLMNYFSGSDGESDFIARILTAEGAVRELKVRDTISYNGAKKSARAVGQLMDAGNSCEQLINYSVNESGMISSIDSADENYIGVDEANIDKFTMNFKGAGRYRKNNMCFNSKYLIDTATPIFLIPYSGDRAEYCVKNSSYLTNNWTYDISVYDIDDYMYASAIVVRENLIEPENLRTKRSLIVTKVVEALNNEDEIATLIEGYYQGSKSSYFLAEDNLRDNRDKLPLKELKAGDVIQFEVNTKNEINAAQLLYRASLRKLSIAEGTTESNKYWEGGSAVFPDLWLSNGTVVDRSGEILLVDADGDETKISKDPHKLGNVTTYLYENKGVEVSGKNEITIGDEVYVHEYQGNVQEIIIVR